MSSDAPSDFTMSPISRISWQAIPEEQALALLNSDRKAGLSLIQVKEKQRTYGKNELIQLGIRSSWTIFIDQFSNVMLLMLIAVALISAAMDIYHSMSSQSFVFPKDAIAILVIVLLNGILGYLQESRAEKALAALRNLSSSKVRVIRQSKIQEIDSQELVPGDLMLLETGVKVPADGRILELSHLQIRESTITGESEAVRKQCIDRLPEDIPLGDRLNLVFSGTEVVQGRGTILVTETGMRTELGQIATEIQSIEAEPTPLQKRMTQLGNTLVTGSLILVALVIGIGTFIRPQLFLQLVEVSLSMAVAVVPEGLPAVITVTLALGTQRMVKRNALIRKLTAVETLGSVTTICSDKTGTLTLNKMVIQSVFTHSGPLRVTGEGYCPDGSFQSEALDRIDPQSQPELQTLMTACVVCNDAVLQKKKEDWVIMGDPTEGALLVVAGKAGLFRKEIDLNYLRIAEFPFDSERQRMSVIVSEGSMPGFTLFVKGSPESLLDCCTQMQKGDRIQPLTPAIRDRILEENNYLARRGLRVLGVARHSLQEVPKTQAEAERDLTWLGLVGMLDAPRPEVREAVKRCHLAGIRPVMITGDHPLTAQAIAEDLGIISSGNHNLVLTGQELEAYSDRELDQLVKKINVYARVSSHHKLRVVQALRRQNQVVAMTGDGVNDAPALKQADIGVAMGITGTDVTKEASDMILLDDNFATIIAAIEEGRVVYNNIRRFIRYILGSNIGEMLTIASVPLLGLSDLPLSPLQILWMNLVTDGVPALALAVEPGHSAIMRESPKNPQEGIFARGLGFYMIRVGLVLATVAIALMLWAYGYTPEHTNNGMLDRDRWKTMVFTMLCLSQMGHALAVRSLSRMTIELNPFSNPFLLISIIITSLLQLCLVYVEPLRNFFGTQYLPLNELLICLGFSSLVFVWVEIEKFLHRWSRSHQKRD